ncbi:MAG: methyltransferase domain-containing protein [Alphaproteobacteria bacterium]|nr:methyltransferase domain-containing protein [Alphaproteobacteria bacterium]
MPMTYSSPPKTFPPLTEEQRRISDDFMRHWHEILPRRYGLIERFNHGFSVRQGDIVPGCRTLEIGAGIGEHIHYEDVKAQDYYCLELRQTMAEKIQERWPNVKVAVGDCQQRLNFDDGFFNRIVAIHVLEHLPDLPAAINEMARLLNSEGVFHIVIPCDPGLLYGLARKISAERIFRRRYRQSYDWFIRREHINAPSEILSMLDRLFVIERREFFPFRIPLINLNLCLGLVARKRPGCPI